ncbi:MAG: HDIG domain-containing protein [Candidatus Eisenbacteria bacterium]|uniref:HDIG domain-containing protein n=1 Tax=Eiseniibacteriota bacterium TaxID=2212470 RepID=A0A538SGM3_UNCEI|nr:MAG: HDIG domain-containing protein [Candidatus Eisenbacteria bacterium]
MSPEDAVQVPALPDRVRSVRWGYYAVRVLLVAVLLVVAGALPGGPRTPERYRYREGEIARERVIAPYDFRVEKDEIALRREQQSAAAAVPPVYMVDARASSDLLTRFASFREQALAAVLDATLPPAGRTARLRAAGVPLSDDAALALAAPGRARRSLELLGGWLSQIYDAGLVAEKRNRQLLGYDSVSVREGERETLRPASSFYDRREAMEFIGRRAGTSFAGDPQSMRVVTDLSGSFLQPNVLHDRAETEWRRVQAQAQVPATVGYVQKDELLVDANQRVTHDALLKLRSLRNLEEARRGRRDFLYPPLARMLLMLLFIAVFVSYLRMELPGVYRDNAMLAMFTLLTVVVMTVTEGMVSILGLSEFTVPLALAPLVVASLLEKRPALVFTLVLAVTITAVGELHAPFAPVAALGGVTAVYSVSRLRHRWHFARATLVIAVVTIAAILAWDLARSMTLSTLLRDVMWGGLSSFLSVSLAFLLLPPVEHLFGLTSDITLLELSDLNRPLLKRMQLEVPGTYHHSMVVGSLAEAAAESLGANSLLARVSAYYHDIGKLSKPEYFAENEPISSRSRHEKLAPSMSALVVKSHIPEGLELARRERLPRAVQNAIPEHHGTMVMAFFYVKAQELDPNVRREDYCYPGPKPRSRETAILMLADGVEGASRALAEPTPSRIRGLVMRIIDERVQEGQLDQCGLTLQDLAKIREAFIPVLTAIFHVRAPYPEDPRKRPRTDTEARKEPA